MHQAATLALSSVLLVPYTNGLLQWGALPTDAWLPCYLTHQMLLTPLLGLLLLLLLIRQPWTSSSPSQTANKTQLTSLPHVVASSVRLATLLQCLKTLALLFSWMSLPLSPRQLLLLKAFALSHQVYASSQNGGPSSASIALPPVNTNPSS